MRRSFARGMCFGAGVFCGFATAPLLASLWVAGPWVRAALCPLTGWHDLAGGPWCVYCGRDPRHPERPAVSMLLRWHAQAASGAEEGE